MAATTRTRSVADVQIIASNDSPDRRTQSIGATQKRGPIHIACSIDTDNRATATGIYNVKTISLATVGDPLGSIELGS